MNILKLFYYKILFNKKKVINYPLIYQEYNSIIKLYKSDNILIEKLPNIGTLISNVCKKANVNPRIITTLLISLTNNLKKGCSTEELMIALGFPQIQTIECKILMYIRLAAKRNKERKDRKVRVSDCKDFEVKNDQTLMLYQLLPFVGNKKFYVYEQESDKDGNIQKVDKVLKNKPPFGVFKYWLIDRKINE